MASNTYTRHRHPSYGTKTTSSCIHADHLAFCLRSPAALQATVGDSTADPWPRRDAPSPTAGAGLDPSPLPAIRPSGVDRRERLVASFASGHFVSDRSSANVPDPQWRRHVITLAHLLACSIVLD